MPLGERALFRAFPGLEGVPFVSLGTFPTPVEELDLSATVPSFHGRAWLKREDLSAEICGGNKVRKLEFLLGRARARGASTVLTLGGIGSNHCLATAYHAPRIRVRAHLVIFPHEVTPTSRRTLRAMCGLGARLEYAPSANLAPLVLARAAARLTLRGGRPAVFGPGGSSPTGTLGYVNAGLELAEQIGQGECDAPDVVFLAYGSGGSAAGLSVGLQLGGYAPLVIAVRVYPLPGTSTRWLHWLASSALRRIGARAKAVGFDASRLRVAPDYLGDGYAVPTAAGSAAREVAAELGFRLEPTYTAKAFAAFLDAAGRRAWRDARMLFVQTYDARLPPELTEDVPDERVPERFRAYV